MDVSDNLELFDISQEKKSFISEKIYDKNDQNNSSSKFIIIKFYII